MAVDMELVDQSRVLNINVAVIGHVDSGKTSLVKALSTVFSTAALDKHPQSRERGITIDLGFSAVTVPAPESLRSETCEFVQFTLVDCPGHASLIRTIIGGAAIVDMALLVIDVVKGLQAQTAECAAVAEAALSSSDDVIIALNKVDLLPVEGRSEAIERATRRVRRQLAGTKFASAEAVPVAAAVGGEKSAGASAASVEANRSAGERSRAAAGGAAVLIGKGKGPKGGSRVKAAAAAAAGGASAGGSASASLVNGNDMHEDGGKEFAGDADSAVGTASGSSSVGGADGEEDRSSGGSSGGGGVGGAASEGVAELLRALTRQARLPQRRDDQPFYMAIDHCFALRGKGTVLTGTVLSGRVAVAQSIELPLLHVVKKVKSMQIFRSAVTCARQGDRVGVCVAGLDPALVERGVAATPGTVSAFPAAIALVRRVVFFAGRVPSGSLLHVTLGHSTVMAKVTFFGAKELAISSEKGSEEHATAWEGAFEVQEELAWDKNGVDRESSTAASNGVRSNSGNAEGEGLGRAGGSQKPAAAAPPLQFALLRFQSPVLSLPNGMIVGSRLDVDGQSLSSNSTEAAAGSGVVNSVGSNGGPNPLAMSRIAFYGRLVAQLPDAEAGAKRVRLYTEKVKEAAVVRVGVEVPAAFASALSRSSVGGGGASEASACSTNSGTSRYHEVIGRGLFTKAGVTQRYLGLLVETETGELGRIEGAFGTGGKFKVVFPTGAAVAPGDRLLLRHRKFLGDKARTLEQKHTAEAYRAVCGGAAAATASVKAAEQAAAASAPPAGVAGKTGPVAAAAASTSIFAAGAKGVDAAREGGSCGVAAVSLNGSASHEAAGKRPSEVSSFKERQKTATALDGSLPPPPPVSLADDSARHTAGKRVGSIEALKGESLGDGKWSQAIVSGLFTMEEDIRKFAGDEVVTAAGERGRIVGPFGKLGKCRVAFENGTAGPIGAALQFDET